MDKSNGSGKGSFDFEKLQLKSPCMEFEEFVRARVNTAERLGDKDEVALYLEALELGKKFLSKKIGGLS
ncbi:MAG: hypothetical protein HY303_00180 [Candidatus Wallbacteria bacterium]|nr:hypothetical protein [Candidatus Wallbacteria bacterium]